MSAAVLSRRPAGNPESPSGAARTALRFFGRRPDFLLLAVALPVFLATELPLAAWAVVAAVWTLQAVLQVAFDAKVASTDNPRRVIALLAGGALVRAWTVATALLITGLLDKDTGLIAVVFTLVLFTLYFAARVFGRLLDDADTVSEAGR
ncbi:MAG: hypothetical protein HZB14_05520 [Actinobacteria bacterium]|nr:hypothetical protein [Actinomycetota bacterium]